MAAQIDPLDVNLLKTAYSSGPHSVRDFQDTVCRPDWYAQVPERIQALVEDGYLSCHGEEYSLTRKGRQEVQRHQVHQEPRSRLKQLLRLK